MKAERSTVCALRVDDHGSASALGSVIAGVVVAVLWSHPELNVVLT